MARIKKRGLDYFPISPEYLNNRLMRRLMKKEGDAAPTVILSTLCAIYTGEGYYLLADEAFYEDLAEHFYEKDEDDVRRIVCRAVELGLFDRALFERYGILTSADIQRQYLFSTRKRKENTIDERYCLVPVEEEAKEEQSAAETPVSAEFKPENDDLTYPGTQSIAQHSIEKHSKAQHTSARGGAGKGGDAISLQPPQDGVKRNFAGLLEVLRTYRVPDDEQRAIVLKSNYGVIGHPVWKAIGELRTSYGKIRLPGRYLLSAIHAAGR